MASAELHIHLTSPVDMSVLEGLIDKAVEAQVKDQTLTRVPPGYRCASCFRADGGHEASCEVGTRAAIT